ncbi:MAG TPA: hypothetical protein VGR02_05480 [Thermoanaerobaculia bacterium]|nr:hypothetical protein [Thermoanaerobaculia bacterium]
MRFRGVLEAAVIVVFALLVWNNYSLRRQHIRPAAAAVKSARSFVVHDSLSALPVTDLTGAARTLALSQRTIVAIVDPRCDSCRTLLAAIRPESGAQVLSVASLAETRAMAEASGLQSVTYVLGNSTDPRLQIYPQLFVVDGGKVVRTCASMAECYPPTARAPSPRNTVSSSRRASTSFSPISMRRVR